MQVNERYKTETLKVVLENGIDFKPGDCMRFPEETKIIFGNALFEISTQKLEQIARSIGFDECARCSKLTRITQQFVNAEFVRYL